MNYQVLESRGKKYLYILGESALIQKESDVMDFISLAIEHDTRFMVFDNNILSEDFLNLRTGLAGAVLQKFANYNLKAAVIKDDQNFPMRFQEMVSDLSTSNTFQVFNNMEDALNWLLA
mgnify:CR=1 FL=1